VAPVLTEPNSRKIDKPHQIRCLSGGERMVRATKRLLRRFVSLRVNALSTLLGFALMSAYWPGISGVATTPRWIVGVVIALAWCFSGIRTEFRPVHWFGLALIAVMALSLAWSGSRLDGVDALFKVTIIACAFMWGGTLSDARPFVNGAAIGLAISSGIAIAQALGWQGVETYAGGDAGLFFNRDRLAAAAALVAAGVLALNLPRWCFLVLLPSLILAQSRAAWLAVAIGLFAVKSRSKRMKAIMAVVLVGGALITLLARVGDSSVNERLALWHDTLAGLNTLGTSLVGHGLGSFYATFPRFASWFDIASTRPDHPHNELLWFAYEGGFLVVLVAGAFAVALWRTVADDVKPVLVATFVLAMFAMPLHDPATAVVVAVLAGFGCRDPLRVWNVVVAGGGPLQQRMAFESGRARAF
jgi:hypothetical protein